MKTIANLRGLLIHQIALLLSGEKQQLRVLPGLRSKAYSIELKKIIERNMEETVEQINRLKNILKFMNEKYEPVIWRSMRAQIREGLEVVKASSDVQVTDAGILAAIQTMKHNEISAYGTTTSIANILGYFEIAEILHKGLEEEKKTDKDLSNLAESNINIKAKNPVFA